MLSVPTSSSWIIFWRTVCPPLFNGIFLNMSFGVRQIISHRPFLANINIPLTSRVSFDTNSHPLTAYLENTSNKCLLFPKEKSVNILSRLLSFSLNVIEFLISPLRSSANLEHIVACFVLISLNTPAKNSSTSFLVLNNIAISPLPIYFSCLHTKYFAPAFIALL